MATRFTVLRHGRSLLVSEVPVNFLHGISLALRAIPLGGKSRQERMLRAKFSNQPGRWDKSPNSSVTYWDSRDQSRLEFRCLVFDGAVGRTSSTLHDSGGMQISPSTAPTPTPTPTLTYRIFSISEGDMATSTAAPRISTFRHNFAYGPSRLTYPSVPRMGP